MKKTILLLFVLLFAMGSLSAQEKGQFVLQTEANAGIMFCYPYQGTFNSIDLEGVVGPVFRYQVTDRLGVGIGANYCVHQFLQYLPIFADAKYSFGSSNAKPYAELRAGYAFSLKRQDTWAEGGYSLYYSVEGFYSQLILGYSIGHSDFGIGGQLVNLKDEGIEFGDGTTGSHPFVKNRLKPGVFFHYAYSFYFCK